MVKCFLPILFLLGPISSSLSWATTCRALMFNGASSSTCAPGLNDSSYELDLLRYSSTLPADCQGTKLSGNSGAFSCLRSDEATREGLNPWARPDGVATVNNFETNFQNGLRDANFTGDSFQLYMTDHGGKGASRGDFSVSAFNPNAESEPASSRNMSYYRMAGIIRANNGMSIRTNADGTTEIINDDIIRRLTNVHAVLDHCNSGGGLSLLMKAGVDSIGSTVCGVAAADANDWSYSSITLGKLRADFLKEFGRAPSDGELHRMAMRHGCYPSVPQLSSDLYLMDVVFNPDPYPEESEDSTLYITALNPQTGRNQTVRGMCLAQGLNLPEVPAGITETFHAAVDSGNRALLEERIKAMSDDFKKMLALAGGERSFSSCGTLSISTLQCYMRKMDSSLETMEGKLAETELKHKIELNKSLAKELGVTIPALLKRQLNSSNSETKSIAADELASLVESAKNKLLNLEARTDKVIRHLCESRDGRCLSGQATLNAAEEQLKNELLERARQSSSYKEEAQTTKTVCDEQKGRCDRVRALLPQAEEKCRGGCRRCPALVVGDDAAIRCHSDRTSCQMRCELLRLDDIDQYLSNVPQHADCQASVSDGLMEFPIWTITERVGMGYTYPSCTNAYNKCNCQRRRVAFEERQQARILLYQDRAEAPEKIRKVLDKQRALQFAQWGKEGAYKSKFKNLRRAKAGAEALANVYKLLKQGKPQQIRAYAELLACEREGIPEGEAARTSALTPSRARDCR
ncbi:MAG: hypothetical protein HYV97_15105 [Bdellovibrio sp.]|nr:hypothetical protein [Bdellovibrio sp.]